VPFDHSLLVKIAQTLQELGKGEPDAEAYHRSVASRAYYGPYGCLRTLLESIQPAVFGKSGRHKALIASLVGSADAHVKRIGVRLNNLKVAREHADYEPQNPFSETTAETCISTGSTTVDKIQKLARSQLQDVLSRL
jgi:hypothetical protein